MTHPISADADGFGRRSFGVDPETGEPVEQLDFVPELVEHQAFVSALAERVARLSTVKHASYVRLRRLDRPSSDRLLLVSDRTPGWRLSEMLSASEEAGISIDMTIVIALMRQLLPAVALFSRHNRENAIGTLSPYRLIVTPRNRLVIAEHAFGPALEKLNFGREKLWRDFRITMPAQEGLVRANQRADASAVGAVALSLLLGRVLRLDEYPAELEALVQSVTEQRAGDATPLSASFATWLSRALQFDSRTAFQTPSEAQLAFESVLASDRAYVTSSKPLEEWVKAIGAALDDKDAQPPPESESDTLQEPAVPAASLTTPALSFLREDYSELPQTTDAEESEPGVSDTSWAPRREQAQYLEAIAEPSDEVPAVPMEPRLAPQPEVEVEIEAAAQSEGATAAAEYPAGRADDQVSQALQALDETAALSRPEISNDIEAPQAPDAPQAPGAPYAPDAPYAPNGSDTSDTSAPDPRSRMLVRVLAGLVVLLIGIVSWQFTRPAPELGVGEGELVITSSPEGARVTIEGTQRGVTPLTVRLNAGAYVVEVQAGKSEPRVIPVQVKAGMSTAQYVELQGVTVRGVLEIRSEPSGARVSIDGQARGTTPMTISDLPPGEHTVVLEARGRKVQQSVRIEAGSIARVTVPMRR